MSRAALRMREIDTSKLVLKSLVPQRIAGDSECQRSASLKRGATLATLAKRLHQTPAAIRSPTPSDNIGTLVTIQ